MPENVACAAVIITPDVTLNVLYVALSSSRSTFTATTSFYFIVDNTTDVQLGCVSVGRLGIALP